jgi:glucosylceramidase
VSSSRTMAKPTSPVRWISTTADQPWSERTAAESSRGGINLSLSGSTYQTWQGFGGCFNEIGWSAMTVLKQPERRKILESLFHPQSGCRFTLCRLPIGASDYALEWYSHNEHAGDYAMEKFSIDRDHHYLLPYIKAALAIRNDLRLFASPWSPPTWMKNPRAYNYGTLISEKRNLAAYALYFLKFVQAYASQGVNIEQVHVQNEPVADQKFPSCLWTGEQLRDFIRDHIGPLFAAKQPGTSVWLGTLNTDDYNKFPLTVLSDEKAQRFTAGVGLQWAGKGVAYRLGAAWPDVPMMQTENECGDGKNTWQYAQYIFDLMQHYITAGVVGYTYWNMVLPPEGKSTWGWRQNAMITVDPATRVVTYNPEFYVMQHFAHFVEPGAVRLGLNGSWMGNSVAFRNPDGRVIVVMNNPLATSQVVNLRIGETAISTELPADSFNTIVVKSE